ncbi:hypothetical protein B0H16DRAFT_1797253, partial [Mycena metata]
DFANPEVAPYIQKYPEDVAGGPISEIWQVKDGKWHDIHLDALTPSILIGHHRYLCLRAIACAWHNEFDSFFLPQYFL